jgi:hypothetical protein
MNNDKLNFVLQEFPSILDTIDANVKPKWGKMNLQQMIEHFADSVREANGKVKRDIVTPEDKIVSYYNFLMSDKEFKPETKNPIMPVEPSPVTNTNKEEAIAELRSELKDFVAFYQNNPDAKNAGPVFGHLNFEEWVQLLHKHAVHHLKQFGAM